jgi:hypothetical protein
MIGVLNVRRTLIVATALIGFAFMAQAADYSMTCRDDQEYAFQSSSFNGKTQVNSHAVGPLTGSEPCPVSLTLQDGKLTGFEECSDRISPFTGKPVGRLPLDLQIVIDHAGMGIPGEVIALEKIHEVEAHLWAISFNRKEAAVTMAFTNSTYTEGGVNTWHCK